MKKLIYCIFVLAIVSTIFLSCNKESLEISSLKSGWELDFSNIYSDGRMLIFKYVQDYELLVNDPSEELVVEFLDYISNMEHKTQADYLSTLTQKELDSIDYDEYLSKILNEDCIVQIGEYLYKVNTATEKVYVMHEKFIEDYEQLVEENLDAGKVQEFSTGDDVIYIVEGVDSLEKSCGGIGGGTYNAYSNPANNALIIAYIGNYAIRLNPYVKMFRAGIYYKLSAHYMLHSAVSNLGGIFNIIVEVKGWQGGWYKKRPCGANDIGTLTANSIIINSSGASGSYTFYSGTRNLNGYYFFVRAKCTNCEGFTQWTLYGGRNINSPY